MFSHTICRSIIDHTQIIIKVKVKLYMNPGKWEAWHQCRANVSRRWSNIINSFPFLNWGNMFLLRSGLSCWFTLSSGQFDRANRAQPEHSGIGDYINNELPLTGDNPSITTDSDNTMRWPDAGLRRWLSINPLTAKLFNLNFHPLEVVSRWRDPQLQVSENLPDLAKWR